MQPENNAQLTESEIRNMIFGLNMKVPVYFEMRENIDKQIRAIHQEIAALNARLSSMNGSMMVDKRRARPPSGQVGIHRQRSGDEEGRMTIIVRGYGDGKLVLEETVEFQGMEELDAIAARQLTQLVAYKLHMIEIWQADPLKCMLRFGTDPTRMVLPQEIFRWGTKAD